MNYRPSRKNVKSYLKAHAEDITVSKASLVQNWLGHQCSMTLKSLDVDKGFYNKIFEVLGKIFWPEANVMMSHLGFIESRKSKASLWTFS